MQFGWPGMAQQEILHISVHRVEQLDSDTLSQCDWEHTITGSKRDEPLWFQGVCIRNFHFLKFRRIHRVYTRTLWVHPRVPFAWSLVAAMNVSAGPIFRNIDHEDSQDCDGRRQSLWFVMGFASEMILCWIVDVDRSSSFRMHNQLESGNGDRNWLNLDRNDRPSILHPIYILWRIRKMDINPESVDYSLLVLAAWLLEMKRLATDRFVCVYLQVVES